MKRKRQKPKLEMYRIFLFTVIFGSSFVKGDQLCFRDESNAAFLTSPGIYDNNTINMDECILSCQLYASSEKHSVMSAGSCFCGDAGPVITANVTGTCDLLCEDNSGCGSSDPNTLYIQEVTPMDILTAITFDHDPVGGPIYGQFSLTVKTVGSNISTVVISSQDCDDITQDTTNGSVSFSFVLKTYGSLRVYAKASAYGVTVYDQVDIPVSNIKFGSTIELTCPPHTGTFLPTPMLVKADAAVNSILTLESDGKFITVGYNDSVLHVLATSTLAPPMQYSHCDKTTLAVNDVLIIPSMTVQHAGSLRSVTLESFGAGNVDIKIFRPTCSGAETYCLRSKQCSVNLCDEKQPNTQNEPFNATSSYNLASKSYYKMFSSALYSGFTKSLELDQQIDSFSEIGVKTLIFPKAGDYTFDVTPGVDVFPGDILGIKLTTTEALTKVLGPTYNFVTCRQGASYDCIPGLAFNMEVNIIRAKEMSVDIFYVMPGLVDVTATLANTITHANISDNCTAMQVYESVQNITITKPVAVATTNQTYSVMVDKHAGYDSCIYNLSGGGLDPISTEEKTLNFTFTSDGSKQLIIDGYNIVNVYNYEFEVDVEDEIMDLSVVADPAVATINKTTNITITTGQGTNVNYTLSTGDGQVFEVTNYTFLGPEISAAKGTITLLYTYDSPLNYTFEVFANNHVSNGTEVLHIPAQVEMSGLQITHSCIIPYFGVESRIGILMAEGTNMTFRSTFNNILTSVFSMEEMSMTGYADLMSERDFTSDGPYELFVEAANLVPPFTVNDSCEVYVEYNITDLTVDMNAIHVKVGDDVVFTVTMTFGSRVTCILDYQDNSTDEVHRVLMKTSVPASEPIIFTHAFMSPDVYDTRLHCRNNVSEETIITTITIQHPVVDIDMTVQTPVPLTNGIAQTIFSIIHGAAPHPTNASYIFENNENVSHALDLTKGDVDTPWTYDTFGDFVVSINASNLVSFFFVERTVVVDEPVTGLVAVSDLYACRYGTFIEVNTTLLTGSRVLLTHVWKDGAANTTLSYSKNESNLVKHRCNVIGIHLHEVYATHSLGTSGVTLPLPVTTQHPIPPLRVSYVYDTYINTLNSWSQTKTFTILYSFLYETPTDPFWKADYDDGYEMEPKLILRDEYDASQNRLLLTHLMSVSHTFTIGKDYNVTFYVWNYINNVSSSHWVQVYEEITDLSMEIVGLSPSGDLKGVGPSNNFFALENFISFKPNFTRGNNLDYLWDFDDGSTENTLEPYVNHKFDKSGTYNILLKAKNKYSEKTTTKEIHFQRGVDDVALSCHSPVVMNTSLEYQVDMGSIGTAACYFINFKDPSSDDSHFLFLGDVSQCLLTHPQEFSDSNRRYLQIDVKQLESRKSSTGVANITVHNTFQTPGEWFVSMTVTNIVSSRHYEWRTGVVKGPCAWPVVDMDAFNGCTEGNCDGNKNLMHHRSESLTVKALLKINCSIPTTAISWEVYKIDEVSNSMAPYPTKVVLEGSPEIIFGPREFEYGLYFFFLNVSMSEYGGIYTLANTTIRIVPTPLECGISSGLKQRIKYNSPYIIDASDSVDPDVDPAGKGTENLDIYWLCRLSCQQNPVYNDDYTEVLTPGTSSCPPLNPLLLADGGGCFLYDGIDQAGLIQASSSKVFRGVLNNTLEASTMEWEVDIRGSHGRRCPILTHSLDVTARESPRIELTCVKNCDSADYNKVLTMKSRIVNYDENFGFRFKWRLKKGPIGAFLPQMKEVPLDADIIPTGLDTPYLALPPNTFSPSDSANQFLMILNVYFIYTDENYGEQLYMFYVNGPPTLGACQMNVGFGTAFETRFFTPCSVPFKDDQVPLTYQISYKLEDDKPWTDILSGISQLSPNNKFVLPPGLDINNNTVTVRLEAKDSLNAKSYLDLYVQVAADNVNIEDLASSSGGKVIQDIEASNNLEGSLDIIYAYVNYLDNEVSSSSSNWTVGDEVLGSKEITRRIKGNFIEMAQNTTIGNLNSRKQYEIAVSIMEVLTRVPGDVVLDGMNIAANFLKMGTAAAVHYLDLGETPASEFEDKVKLLLMLTGNVMKIAKWQEENGIAEREQVAPVEDTVKGNVASMMVAVDKTMVAREGVSQISSIDGEIHMTFMKGSSSDFNGEPVSVGLGITMNLPLGIEIFQNETFSATAAAAAMLTSPLYEDNSQDALRMSTGVLFLLILHKASEPLETEQVPTPMQITFKRTTVKQDNYTNSCYTVDPNPKKRLVHSFRIPANASYHIKVKECVDNVSMEASTSSLNANSENSTNATTASGTTASATTTSSTTTVIANVMTNQTNNLTSNGDDSSIQELYNQYLCSDTYEVFVALDRRPKENDYDHYCKLPLNPLNLSRGNDSEPLSRTDLFICFQSNKDIKSPGAAIVNYIVTVTKSTVSCESQNATTHRRRRRSASGGDQSYQFTAFSSQCKIYNENTMLWESTDNEEVGPYTNETDLQCKFHRLAVPVESSEQDKIAVEDAVDPNMIPPPPSPKASAFGCGFAVPVNTINPADSAFNKLDSNPVIFAVMVAIICMYIVIIIWATKADRVDALKIGSSPLLDNDPEDKYLYELTIYTGSKSNAGTTARVSMVFSGDIDETHPRLIFDENRPVLQRGDINTFIMSVPDTLGPLSHMRVWHDNSGSNPSWLFSRMTMVDLQTGHTYFFIADKWLAVDEDDGMIDRIVPLAGHDELTNFNHLFWTRAKSDLFDGHLWFSIAGRPARSNFTRCQRLTCCVSLLFCTMMANILFYDTDDGSAPATSFSLGPVTFTVPMIITGIYSSLIVFPVNLLIVQIFRYSRPAKTTADKLKEEMIEAAKARHVDKKGTIKELEHARHMLDNPSRYFDFTYGHLGPFPSDTTSICQSFSSLEEPKLKEKKKKFRLPHWFIYVAYAICFASCGVSFYITVEIGGVFGAAKSNKWMVSFVVSCIESIFFTQPIKVVCLAIFYALVIKSPIVEEDDESDPYPDYEHSSHGVAWKRKYARYENVPVPPDQDYLKYAREKKMKETEMQAIIFEIIRYVIFLYLLLMVGYGGRDPWSNSVYQTMELSFKAGDYGSTNVSYGIDKVTTFDNFWTYMRISFLPAFYSGSWYNGKNYWFTKGFISDRNNHMMGAPRLRQVRMPNFTCQEYIQRVFIPPGCRGEYSINDEDQGQYHKNWAPVNTSDPGDIPVDTAWFWQSPEVLDGIGKHGLMSHYGGGGFIANLTTDGKTAEQVIDDLQENDWIDKNTRGVFIEFNLFNPHLNLQAVSNILFEFYYTGGVHHMYSVYILRLDRYSGEGMMMVILAEIVTYAFTIYFIVVEVKKIILQKKKYFLDFWNAVEFLVICFLVLSFGVYVYRLILMSQVLAKFRSNKQEFINLQNVCLWDELFGYLFSFIIFIATVKVLKLLRFNKKMNMFGQVLAHASRPILSFLMVFTIVLTAYSMWAWLVFGYKLYNWRSFIASMETLCSLMLNKFDFYSLREADGLYAPIIFFTFTVLVNFMTINLFLTMLMYSHSIVKEEIEDLANDYEMVEYITGVAKGLLGISKKKEPTYQQQKDEYAQLEFKVKFINDTVGDHMKRDSVYDKVAHEISNFLLRNKAQHKGGNKVDEEERKLDQKADILSSLMIRLMNGEAKEEEIILAVETCEVEREFLNDILMSIRGNSVK